MKKYILLLCGIAVTGLSDPGPLTLEQALELARKNSPELRAVRMHLQSAEKGVAAAGLRINPELEFEAEGVGLDNDLSNEGEYALGISQEFQTGGKRKKARTVARKSVGIASQFVREKDIELTEAVRHAFIVVMAMQEIRGVQAEQMQLGRAFVKVAKRHHKAGGGSELDVVQAELAMEEIVLSQTCYFSELLAARIKLASLLRLPVEELPELTAPYYNLEVIENVVLHNSHPSLRRLEIETEKVRAEAVRAKAEDTANISLGAGYKYEAVDDNSSLIFSASVPLSFSRRGRAEHAAGLLRATAVESERTEVRRKLQSELTEVLALYKGVRAEVALLKNRLIPKAEQAHELSRTGYDAGRFSWLELIEAQQNLADIRIRYIESLRDAHLARAKIYKFMKEEI